MEKKSRLLLEGVSEKILFIEHISLAYRAYALYHEDMEITERQKEILTFIQVFHSQEGGPPSLREMCRGLGLASSGSLLVTLRTLETKGYLVRNPGKNRRWQLANRQPSACIPLIGQIAAGEPILADQNKETDLPIDPKLFGTQDVFALRVRGDSMRDAHVLNGDLAVIRPQSTAENGEIVAVLVEGLEAEATLKIFRRNNGDIELHPANSMYQVLCFNGKERGKVQILGKLVGIIRPKL
jgi:repressor LexA